MYDIQFEATSSADWAVALQLIDDDTNLSLDLSGLSFELEIKDQRSRLSLSSTDGSITVPAPGVMQWIVPAATMRGLRDCSTYRVGCTVTSDGGTDQLFTGTLALLDGDVS